MSAQSMVSTLYFVCGQGLGNVFWMSLYDRMPTAAPLYFLACVLLVGNILGTDVPDFRVAVKDCEAFDV